MVDIERDQSMKHLVELTEENNKLLKKMHRAHLVDRTIRLLYWVVIIGASVGAFYVLQPYLDELKSIYGDFQGVTEQVGGLFDRE